MFDLIIAYLVIMFLVNTAKSAKEQQKKGTSSAGKRNPRAPMPTAAPVRPVPQEVKRQTVTVPSQKVKGTPQPAAVQRSVSPKEVKKSLPVKNTPVGFSQEDETLSRVLEPTEENILTGLVWSEILGPPVSKRPRRY